MWKSTLMRDPQTLAQSPKHFRGHQDCSQHLEEGTGAAKFKVTWAILDRAELVLGFSVQARVQVCRADLQGWRGPGLPAWGTGLRGAAPSCLQPGLPALLLSLWEPGNSIHMANSFTLSSSKGCFVKACLMLKDASGSLSPLSKPVFPPLGSLETKPN